VFLLFDAVTHVIFDEQLMDGYSAQTHVTKVLHSGHSAFQAIDIYETVPFGKCLVLDGHMQSATSDEFIYHETLVHTAFLMHPNPKRVFIGGGGEVRLSALALSLSVRVY
jgi:thermospermine synthase